MILITINLHVWGSIRMIRSKSTMRLCICYSWTKVAGATFIDVHYAHSASVQRRRQRDICSIEYAWRKVEWTSNDISYAWLSTNRRWRRRIHRTLLHWWDVASYRTSLDVKVCLWTNVEVFLIILSSVFQLLLLPSPTICFGHFCSSSPMPLMTWLIVEHARLRHCQYPRWRAMAIIAYRCTYECVYVLLFTAAEGRYTMPLMMQLMVHWEFYRMASNWPRMV
jgi:hypothetical protein